jgi:hypothetical protein
MPPMYLKNSAVQVVPGAIGGSFAPIRRNGAYPVLRVGSSTLKILIFL